MENGRGGVRRRRMRNSNRSSEPTLFLEEVVALETGAEAIKGLAGLADPESDGVECSAQCSHLVLCCVVLCSSLTAQ